MHVSILSSTPSFLCLNMLPLTLKFSTVHYLQTINHFYIDIGLRIAVSSSIRRPSHIMQSMYSLTLVFFYLEI